MKKFYPFATLSMALVFFFNVVTAQTVYTAVRSGNWHNDSGVNPWATSEPSAHCINCTIIINSGVTVHLNESVILSGGSTLVIGTDNSNAAVLMIDTTMGVSDFASAHNVILMNDGSTPGNSIRLANNISFVTFSNTPGADSYDGILTNFGATSYKEVGGAPLSFNGNTIQNAGPAVYGVSLTGPITLGSSGTLPIILSQFDVELNNKEVDLTWTTDQESNSDHFAVERSSNGGARWDVLGTVAAQGNSSVTVHYSYTDLNPAAGINEYRLQSVDRDGQSKYSEVKTIRNGLIGNVSIFPNPAKDNVNVTLGGEGTTGNMSIRLISQSGQLLLEKKVSNTGGTTVTFPVSSYPQGNYLIQVIGQDGTQQISKLFISRQ